MHNDTLVIAEKLHHARLLLEATGHILNRNEVDVLDYRGIGLKYYDIPSRLPISESPKIIPSQWKYRDLSNLEYVSKNPLLGHRYYRVTSNSVRKSIFPSSKDISWSEQIEFVKKRLSGYKRIIIIPDMDMRGIFFTNQLLDELFEEEQERPDMHWIDISNGLHKEELVEQFLNPRDISNKLDLFQRRAEVKYYFDWLWFINSAPVFGKAMKLAGLPSNHILSKYELLTFLLISKGVFEYDGLDKLHHLIYKYKGSGKYSDNPEMEWLNWIGSPSSTYQIVENLVDLGLINDNGLTEKGVLFASHIHKRSFDPDLAARIHTWCQNADFKGVESYIIRFFKKQKNFNSIESL